MRFHLEAEANYLIQSGLAPGEATHHAKLPLASITAMKDQCRQARDLAAIDGLRQSLQRYRASSASHEIPQLPTGWLDPTTDMTSTRDMTHYCATFTGSFGRLAKAAAAIAGLVVLAAPKVAAVDDEAERLDEGIVVLQEIMAAPDSSIPEALLDRAVAIAVFPSTIRAGFIFGGQRGHGFISARRTDTGHWSPPAFLTLTGGSFGLQAGAQEADVVLLIQNRRGLDRLLGNQFTLGGDAVAAVGPVGRSLEASTDLQMTAEILSYSRSRGVFAGVTLGGSTLRADRDANERFYGVRLDSRQIVLEGLTGPSLPEAAVRVRRALDRLAPDEEARE